MSSFWEIKVFLHRLSKFKMTLVADNGEEEIEKEGYKTLLHLFKKLFGYFSKWNHQMDIFSGLKSTKFTLFMNSISFMIKIYVMIFHTKISLKTCCIIRAITFIVGCDLIRNKTFIAIFPMGTMETHISCLFKGLWQPFYWLRLICPMILMSFICFNKILHVLITKSLSQIKFWWSCYS